MDRVKYYFILKKDTRRTNKLRLSNSKATRRGKRYLLISYNVNDVTERAPRDDNGNVTLMAQRAKQDFILQLNLCSNRVFQSITTPILIPD